MPDEVAAYSRALEQKRETVASLLASISAPIDMVGDPLTRKPASEYFAFVRTLESDYHESRALARMLLRRSAAWPNGWQYARASAKGRYHLTFLWLAGLLYCVRVHAVIDAKGHRRKLQSVFR